MMMSTPVAREGRLGDETRSLLRALLLGSIVEYRTASAPTEDLVGLHAAEEALARLDTQAYGICERCGDPMSIELLLITPHAQRCGECPDSAIPTAPVPMAVREEEHTAAATPP